MSSFGEGLAAGKSAVEQLIKIRNELRIHNIIEIRKMQYEIGFLSVEQNNKLQDVISTYVDNIKTK